MSRPLYTQPSVEGAAIEKLISGEQHHKIQRRISEQLWKQNFYKFGYFRRNGSLGEEVSEIREEPDEDNEDNLSKIIKQALESDKPL